MKQIVITVAVVGVMVLLLTSVAHAESEGRRFIGLWQGIDEVDGSEILVLISDDENEPFVLLWRETFFTICANERGFDGRRGVIKGTAYLDPGDQPILRTRLDITCFDPPHSELIRANVTLISFELIDRNRLLVTNAAANFPPFILERISK